MRRLNEYASYFQVCTRLKPQGLKFSILLTVDYVLESRKRKVARAFSSITSIFLDFMQYTNSHGLRRGIQVYRGKHVFYYSTN